MDIQMITLAENFHEQYFQSFVALVLGKILDLITQPYNEIEVTTSSKGIRQCSIIWKLFYNHCTDE